MLPLEMPPEMPLEVPLEVPSASLVEAPALPAAPPDMLLGTPSGTPSGRSPYGEAALPEIPLDVPPDGPSGAPTRASRWFVAEVAEVVAVGWGMALAGVAVDAYVGTLRSGAAARARDWRAATWAGPDGSWVRRAIWLSMMPCSPIERARPAGIDAGRPFIGRPASP
jgi:hypothetical protein